MKKLWGEILRLQVPLILLLAWLVVWGIKESVLTASMFTGFLALSMILGHVVSKELFRGYKWDVGAKLNQAWHEDASISRALLAVGMLIARAMIYIAIVLGMAIITATFLRGSAFGAVSRPTPQLIDILKEEHRVIWPESDICIIMSQIKAESNWKEQARRREKSGVTSYGLLQVLDTTLQDLQKKHKTLKDLEPVSMLQARYGIRAGLLYDLQMWKLCSFADDRFAGTGKGILNRWAFTLSSYNGGFGWVQRDRKLTDIAGGNKNLWFGHVEKYSARSAWAFRINREYPVKIFSYAEQYRRAYL